MTFVNDLAIGRKAEKEFAKVLLDTKQIISLEFAQGKFKDWDIKITTPDGEKTYEVKSDTKAQDTGNYVIETRCSGKPSGIYTSRADYIVYNVKGEWRLQSRSELILRLMDVEKRTTKGGDGRRAEMFVLSCDTLPILFQRCGMDGSSQP